MKKIILGIVFVFASFTMVNANNDIVSTEDVVQFTCDEVASNFASLAYESGYSVEDSIRVYDAIYSNCRQN
ncbi:hypothetical protein [Lutibacter sp.]